VVILQLFWWEGRTLLFEMICDGGEGGKKRMAVKGSKCSFVGICDQNRREGLPKQVGSVIILEDIQVTDFGLLMSGSGTYLGVEDVYLQPLYGRTCTVKTVQFTRCIML
jgi:hypothetical protein